MSLANGTRVRSKVRIDNTGVHGQHIDIGMEGVVVMVYGDPPDHYVRFDQPDADEPYPEPLESYMYLDELEVL